jgi:ankyrin repeat protein
MNNTNINIKFNNLKKMEYDHLQKIYHKYFEDNDFDKYDGPTQQLVDIFEFDEFQKCIDKKANVLTKCGAICLFQAILFDQYKIVSFLMNMKVSLFHESLQDSPLLKDLTPNSMIHYIIKRKRLKLFTLFFTHYALLDNYIDSDMNCLHHCIKHNWMEPLYLLDEYNVSFNLLTKIHGYTPLMLACRYGHYSIVQYLLFQDIYLEYENIIMDTAMSIAIENLQFECVQLLLRNNVRIDEKSKTMLNYFANKLYIQYDELLSFLEQEFSKEIGPLDIEKMNTFLRIEYAIQ